MCLSKFRAYAICLLGSFESETNREESSLRVVGMRVHKVSSLKRNFTTDFFPKKKSKSVAIVWLSNFDGETDKARDDKWW